MKRQSTLITVWTVCAITWWPGLFGRIVDPLTVHQWELFWLIGLMPVIAFIVWRNDSDIFPCPLNKNYQLDRKVLTACVDPGGFVSENSGHVVVIYDERNPAYKQTVRRYYHIYRDSQCAEIAYNPADV